MSLVVSVLMEKIESKEAAMELQKLVNVNSRATLMHPIHCESPGTNLQWSEELQ